eukprot:1256876-Rhodomonas_salina.1
MSGFAAFVAIISVLLGVVINELCVAGDYMQLPPSQEVLAAIETGNGRKCNHSLGAYLKMGQSALTAILVYLVIRQWKLQVNLHATLQKQNNRKMQRKSKNRTPTRFFVKLFLEIAVCLVHPVPYFNIDVKLGVLGQTMFYRLESIACAVMLLRLYLFFRFLYLWAFFGTYLFRLRVAKRKTLTALSAAFASGIRVGSGLGASAAQERGRQLCTRERD